MRKGVSQADFVSLLDSERATIEQLEAIQWSDTGDIYAALDHVFTWRCNDPDVGAALTECFATLPRVDDSTTASMTYSVVYGQTPERTALIYADQERLMRTRRGDHGLRTVTWHVNQMAASSAQTRAVVLHAAAVTQGDRVVVLSAPMESGKSTLCTALVRSGMGYVTDEAVGIDRLTLDVLAYPRAISLDPGSWSLFPELRPRGALGQEKLRRYQWQVPVTTIRPDAVSTAREIAAVVFLRFTPAEPTCLKTVTPAATVIDLGRQTFDFRTNAQANLEVLARLASQVPSYRLDHHDLDEAVGAVRSLLG